MRKPSKNVTPATDGKVVKTKDAKESFRVDHLQHLYVVSGDTPEQFVDKLNLENDFAIDVISASGWEDVRIKHRQHKLKRLTDDMVLNLVQSIENELHQQRLINAHNKILQSEADMHFSKWNDFYVRNEQDQLVQDIHGDRIEIQALRKMKRKDDHVQSHSYVQGLFKLLKFAMLENPGAPTTTPSESRLDLADFGFLPKK